MARVCCCIVVTFFIPSFMMMVSARNIDCQQSFNNTQHSTENTFKHQLSSLVERINVSKQQEFSAAFKSVHTNVTYNIHTENKEIFSKFPSNESIGLERKSEFWTIRINTMQRQARKECGGIQVADKKGKRCNFKDKRVVCDYQVLNYTNAILTIKYRQSYGTDFCVEEAENLLKVNVSGKINATCGIPSIIQPFRELNISTELTFAGPAGRISDCYVRSSNCLFRSFIPENDFVDEKVRLLLHAALHPIFQDRDISRCSNITIVWRDLKERNFSRCNFSTISENYTKEVPQLEILNLAHNIFTELPISISSLVNLQVLDLSGNPISNVTQLSSILENLIQLQSLSLDDIPFRKVEDLQAILDVTTLKTLSLNRCELSRLPNDIFRNQTSLQKIHLSGNLFQTLPNDIFIEVLNLSFINLSHNALHSGPSLQLSSNVQTLDLSGNKITNVSDIITSVRVKNLMLKGNNIREWTGCDIWSSKHNSKEPWVSRLDLSNNSIETITYIMGKSLEGMDEIDLGDNPIDCNNCHTIEFKNWLNSKRNKPSILNQGTLCHITCDLPKDPATHSVMEQKFTPVECNTFFFSVEYISLTAVISIFVIVLVLTVVYRNKIRNIRSMKRKRRENRKRAVCLSPIHYENDIYIICSHEESEFVMSTLCPRLENGSQKYRVFTPDSTSTDFSGIESDMSKSRHVMVIIADSLTMNEFCTRAVDHCIAKNEEAFAHNMIFLELTERSTKPVPSRIKHLRASHDYIAWSLSGKSQEKAWRKLIKYLGTSNYEEWQNDSTDYIAI